MIVKCPFCNCEHEATELEMDGGEYHVLKCDCGARISCASKELTERKVV